MSALPDALHETIGRIGKPVIALFGALVFVNLLMIGGDQASTIILGDALANVAGGAWKYFAPFLGALGSFFSGSTTISNLTFGGIQASIAQDTGLDVGTLLALRRRRDGQHDHNSQHRCRLRSSRARECRRRDPQESLPSGHPLRHHARGRRTPLLSLSSNLRPSLTVSEDC
jgi:hypothetical protein